jgi:predicted nucleic acid-binding protein
LPILLDTSVAIALLDRVTVVIDRRRHENEAAYLSMVSWVELLPGIYSGEKVNRGRAALFEAFLEGLEILPFAELEVHAYETIIAANGFSRRLVVDRMIAATALANDLALATLNPRDFRNIAGLTIEDWS